MELPTSGKFEEWSLPDNFNFVAGVDYLIEGKLEKVWDCLEQISPEAKGTPEFARLLALYYRLSKKWDQLMELCRIMLLREPHALTWWTAYSMALENTEGKRAALEAFIEAEKRFPEDPYIQFRLGCLSFLVNHDSEKARDHLTKACFLEPAYIQRILECPTPSRLWDDEFHEGVKQLKLSGDLPVEAES
jgi:tetratricopeptide (TPR) repeat protein